jgi:DNA-binding NtrC family response regulator
MTLENTFLPASEINESAAPPAWDAMPETMPGAMPDPLQIDGADDDAEDPRCADAGPAHEPRGDRQAVVIDEFDPTLSFRDAKERAIGLWERWYVAELLRHTRGNLSEAARVAHSDRSHLRKLVRKHLHRGAGEPEPAADAG